MSAAPAPTFPVTFAGNGQTLTSTANSPQSIAKIFQNVVAQLFGYFVTPTAAAVTIGNGGINFSVGDIAAINSVTGSLLVVASVSGGAVTGLTLENGGNCQTIGNNLATTAYTGVGTGLTVNVTAITPVSTANDATNPFWTVRIGWQKQGQPAWKIDPNTCIITSYTDDDPYSRVSDRLYTPNNATSINEGRSYTQAWKMRFVNYGDNAFTNGSLIVEGMTLDWVHDLLAAQNIYAVTIWKRPVVTTELFQGQWWQRADVELKFYELVLLNTVVPLGASVKIQIIKENLLNETVNVNI